MKIYKYLFIMLMTLCVLADDANAATLSKATKNKVQKEINATVPAYVNVGKIPVSAVLSNDKTQTITVRCGKELAYLQLTDTLISEMKQAVSSVLPEMYADYRVVITSGGDALGKLTVGAKRNIVGPTEAIRFIERIDGVKAPKGLDGSNIALWQSHGWYFEKELDRWEWQRARIFQTVEDLYTQSYVMPFLMPMLENAGAYVLSPRERDTNVNEIIVDADGGLAYGGYSEVAKDSTEWSDATVKGFAYLKSQLENGDNPFEMGSVRIVNTTQDESKASVAQWNAEIPEAGTYAVYISYASMPNSATDVVYKVNSRAGMAEYKVNQAMGGGTWIYLGHFPFNKGLAQTPIVQMTNLSADEDAVVTADAVKIGGGMGNVARKVIDGDAGVEYEYKVSGYPRFTEGARYFLQWAGVPDNIYTMSGNTNDYTDDYKCRGEWVNYLMGGSSMLPNYKGLNIPIDLSFAFHTDAGTTMNDSIIGTLGIYYSNKGDDYANGTTRYASRDLTDNIMSNIVEDVRSLYEPRWTRRGMWDKSYFEARAPEVPTMLLELLSHQNFADMKYGLDPSFRFTVSRAIYKGMLEFIANRDGREFVVQPLPINTFGISKVGNGKYKLSWNETIDSLEITASPTYYIVEERIEDGEFRKLACVTSDSLIISIKDEKIHSYRVLAGNDGGISFPSEILALCDLQNDKEPVLVVNGFTRVSGPDTFDAGKIAGFNDMSDHGVPYMSDISFVGSQFEFRRDIPWMDDDAAGFGASRANFEDKVIAGNTFDYTYVHGKAIVAAGHSFISKSVADFMAQDSCEYKVVDLILGKQKEIKVGRGAYGSKYKTYPIALQQKLRTATENGTSIFVSGSYIASDLWDNPNATKDDQKFVKEVLGYQWRVGQATVESGVYQVSSRYKQFCSGKYEFHNELNAECYAVESPDCIYEVDKDCSATILRYEENNLIAGVAYAPEEYRTVAIGFPFETIKTEKDRNKLMKEVLEFLTNK